MGIAQSIFTCPRSKEDDEQQLYPFLDNNNNYKKPYNGALSSFCTLFKNLLLWIFPFAKSRKPEPILPVVNQTNNPPFSQISSSSDSSPSPNGASFGLSSLYALFKNLSLRIFKLFPFAKPRKTEPILPVVNPTNNPPFLQIQDSSSSPNTIYAPAPDLNLQLQSDQYHYSSSEDEVQPTTTTWLQKPPFSSAMETVSNESSSSSDSSSSPNTIYIPVPDLNLQLQSDHYSTTTWLQKPPVSSALETECNGDEDEGLHCNKQMDVIINVPSLDYQSLARTSTFDVADSTFICFEKEVKEDEQVVEEKQKNKKIKKINNEKKVEEEKQKKKIKNKKKAEEEEIKCVVDEGKWIKHYHSSHKILLVGEGDFSFSASLAVAFGSASNIIATSLDLRKFLKKNYGNAMVNINNLTSRGCKVVHHGVDATQMASYPWLGKEKFDRIIYNFPYAGFFKDLSKDEQLTKHRRLVSLFLKNAKQMIGENGEIHITHKTNGFHKEWNIENIASSHGLRLIEAVKFNRLDYPGYNTKCGFGGDGNFDCDPAKTSKFGLKK